MPLFFDTHAHLDYPDYAPDFAEVLARAQAAGITKIISIGTSLDSSRRAVASRIASGHLRRRRLASVRGAVRPRRPAPGLARTGAASQGRRHRRDRTGLFSAAQHERRARSDARATEVGRVAPCAPSADDIHYKQRQAEIFQQQLEVAAEFDLNAIIHQRASFDDTLAQLKPFAGQVRGVFHCFGESWSG